jgi:hypothetical protein
MCAKIDRRPLLLGASEAVPLFAVSRLCKEIESTCKVQTKGDAGLARLTGAPPSEGSAVPSGGCRTLPDGRTIGYGSGEAAIQDSLGLRPRSPTPAITH